MADVQREREDRNGRLESGGMEVDHFGRERPSSRRSNGDSRRSDSSGSESDARDRRRAKKRGRESDSSEESPARRRGRPRVSSSSDISSSDSSSDSRDRARSHAKREKRAKRKEVEKAKEEVLRMERAKVEALVASNAALGGRSGGVYIPPHRMALLRAEAEKKAEQDEQASAEYQKMTWEALRKSINGFVNKVSPHNIKHIVVELLQENIYRGRGLLCKSLMKSQSISPKFTSVYAALVAIINTKFPDIGVLLLKRLVDQFKKGYRRRDKLSLLAATKFIAHLVNQMVCGVVLPLQILLLLLERPTDDSIEVAVSLMQEIGQRLSEVSPQAFNGIFDQFRSILHEGSIDKRVEYLIEGLFAVRRKDFAEYPAMPESLDLVEEEDQITHENVSLDDAGDDEGGGGGGGGGPIDIEERLDFFKIDPDFKKHEQQYQRIVDEMLVGGDDGEEGSGSSDESEDSEGDPELTTKTVQIEDATNNELTILKRAIYLTIMSSRDNEEVVHKLRKMKIKPGEEEHVCRMVIQCCAQERTYLKFYGLIAQRLCNIDREFQHWFEKLFAENYETIYRYDNNMLRNVARLFSHLFFTDALPWTAFQCVKLTENETTAASRIFLKILFGDIVEYLGLEKLVKRVQHPTLLHPWLEGMFPTNSPKDTKFAINYWTAIELGALTDNLRAAYNDMIRKIAERRTAEAQRRAQEGSASDSSSSSSNSSGSSYSSSSSSSGSYSSSSSSSSPRRSHRKR
jgi:pre-mRNA-splicing factor CWC22